MEIICRVTQQHPLQQREYTSREGQQQVFTSRGYVLQAGSHTFYAEMTGAQAASQPQVPQDRYYVAEVQLHHETFTTQDGRERHATRVYLNRLNEL